MYSNMFKDRAWSIGILEYLENKLFNLEKEEI